MIVPGAGQLRIARGGVLAALCLALAAGGHLGGGGMLPSPTVLLAVGVLLGGAFVILADRERRLGAIMLAAVGSQALFHLAFELTAHGAHHGAGVPFEGNLSPTLFPLDRMAVAHLVAAVALAVLTRKGESLLWAIAGLLGITRILWLWVAPIESTPLVLRPLVLPARPRSRAEVRIRPRRGPPFIGIPA